MPTLTGKTAIVTGASSGIGRASAVALARDGADVAIAARRESRLADLADEIEESSGGDVLTVPTDVTDQDQVEDLVDRTVDEFGGLDVVVVNAGVGRNGDVEEMTMDDYHTMIDVNVNGLFYTTKAALPHIKESQGNLVFIGSYGAKFPYPYNPVYGGTKYFTRGFSMSLAGSCAEDGIGTTVINPSAVRTEYGKEFRTANKDRWDEGEVTEPEDIAEAVAFAAAQEAPNTVNELDLFKRDMFGA